MQNSWLHELWSAFFDVPVDIGWAAGLVAGLLLIGEVVYRLSFYGLARISRLTTTHLDDLLVKRMRPPARGLWFLLAAHSFLVLRGGGGPGAVYSLLAALELGLLAYIVIEVAETLLLDYWIVERKGVQPPAVIRHLLLTLLYSVAVLFILGNVAGINVMPLLATSTVLTVVLGLALQDTLGNLFAGLSLHVERPFSLGDWIAVDGVEGQVVEVAWRATRIRTLTRDVVSIPNAAIGRARVQNFDLPTPLTGRNVEMLVSLAASPAQVERAVRAAALEVPRILTEPAPKAWLKGQTPLCQRYVIRIWLDGFAQKDDIESDFQKALWVALHAEGIALAPPTTVVAATA
ncbi:mechanosensitive ion channel family protein [Myxococcota bacterium]|nr:mechanosensitive ion channel family protein [Myxococcota bacterium]